MIILRNFSKFFTYLGQIMAFLTIIMLGVIYVNKISPIGFLGDYASQLEAIKDYVVMLTITVCGLGFACRRSLFLFIPFCLLAICAFACYSIYLFNV